VMAVNAAAGGHLFRERQRQQLRPWQAAPGLVLRFAGIIVFKKRIHVCLGFVCVHLETISN
jgi:hypothetical protein